MMKRKLLLLTGVGALIFSAAPVMASNTATSTMTVDAIVDTVCLIDSTSSLHFGDLDSIAGTGASPTANSKHGSGDVNYACTNGSSPVVYLSAASSTLSGTGGNTDTITATYYENDYSTAFPVTSGTGLALTGDGATHTTTIYGNVATSTSTHADTYTGTVDVNIAY